MKWYTYLICFVLIVVGAFCGINLYKEVKAESYVNGSINIINKFSQESFSYYSTSLTFYHDEYDTTETYYFEKELLKVEDFNGSEKEYKVKLNDYVLFNCDIESGAIYTSVTIDFYDTSGNIVCESSMNISIKFLSDKTMLNMATTGVENASFLEQYFSDNGVRLEVNEIL